MDYHMMSYYIHQLQQQVQQQSQQINSLENRIQQLEQQQTGPKTNIEKLEYHFDQLKIERLDGSLHIGVTPEDLQQMEDFSIPQATGSPMPSVHQTLEHYVNQDLPPYIQSLEEQFQYPLDESYRQTLLKDLKQQLTSRIAHYQQAKVPPDQMPQHILSNVQQELQTGLRRWFENQQKG
ncbi:spore germination protein GerPC [Gracilibacillus salinarum]|uniref:Spore germination protein GerPC n=1 Tax=Gracilibacillus salinarum TaxID=2932255 RepID=A0ABY4GQB8_9BACI|nr:spore germination protein GerPC [Gracilibacillus salinarum]UOQ86547.1 spore germination protein GerPC [Gracilibacillus salinarum]